MLFTIFYNVWQTTKTSDRYYPSKTRTDYQQPQRVYSKLEESIERRI